jgi:hypothetical protein
MVRKVILAICITGIVMVYGFEKSALADGGSDFFGHTVRRYDNVIQPVDTDETRLLTKDSVEEVRRFFEQNRQKGDRIDPSDLKGMSAYNLVYAGPEVQRPVLLVSFEERNPDSNIHPALGELKAQAMMGRHSMQEYEALENRYKRLHLAYFREVDDGQGGTVSEGKKIYRATYDQVHGATKAAMKSQTPDQSQKAEAAALKQQMQEMKAKGDIAGMMQMARKFTPAPDQTAPGATAMNAAGADTWDAWVRCLQDIEAVAYRTRISYAPAAWK